MVNRQVPDSVKNINLQPQAAPVDKLIQYRYDKFSSSEKSKALFDGLARLGQGLIDIEPVLQDQADKAIQRALYEEGSNKDDWHSISRNVKGMAQFNPYLKNAYRRMQAQDITRAGALELSSIPSKEQLAPEKYNQIVQDTQTKMLEAFKETGLTPKDYGAQLIAFDDYKKTMEADYFKKHSEYEYKMFLTKSSADCADALYQSGLITETKLEGYTLGLQSYIKQKTEEGVPDGDIAATLIAGVQGYLSRYPENINSADLLNTLRATTINGKSLNEFIPNFEPSIQQMVRQVKRDSYEDRRLEFNSLQLQQDINKENAVKDFFNWYYQNQGASDEAIQQTALEAIKNNNVEGSGGVEFLSSVARTKGFMNSLREVTTDPDAAQEFMAQAASGELNYNELSEAVSNGIINYRDVPQFMSRDKAIKDQLEGQFGDEMKEFNKVYLKKGGAFYNEMDGTSRKQVTQAAAAIQDKVLTGAWTPQQGQKALRILKEKAIPNMKIYRQVQNKNAAVISNGAFRRTVNIPYADSDKALQAIKNMGILRNSAGVRANNITIADSMTNDRNRNGVPNETGDKHLGWDIGGVYIGQPVYPPDDGQVIASGKEATLGYYAVFQYKGGYMLVQHMNQPVMNGIKLSRNDVLGYVGNTGRVSESGRRNGCFHVEFWDKDLNLRKF